MRKYLFILLYVSSVISLYSQISLRGYNQDKINSALLQGSWNAHWISYPGEAPASYGVFHFRKSFDLQSKPSRFVVHISADNRYKFFVNGKLVSLGPSRGDIYNWNFETLDIAPYLKAGSNMLASVVWNYADLKPVAQISFGDAAFIIQGDTELEYVVNSDDSWRCLHDKAYSPYTKWSVPGYYVAGPGELLDASIYPWGWERDGYDDSAWEQAVAGREGAIKGARDYPGRLLVPSPIPQMDHSHERFSKLRMAEGVECPEGFPYWPRKITVPANSEVRLLLDNGYLTTGYFSIDFSCGKGTEILVGYSEALYKQELEPTTKSYRLNGKGDRDLIDDKIFIGYQDKILADGGENRNFTSLWWRTWRYVELKVKSADEPLVIDDIYSMFSAYPFRRETSFAAPGHEELVDMLDIGWRTARLCANETYMDCPYYEQLQYFGDTRIQAMISLYNTRDSFMVKNAIEQGRQSMVSDGITMSRYPSNLHQFISSFSLWWICMGHDYWMYRGDEQYMRTLLPAYRQVLSWYERWLKPDYSLGYVPHWFFLDWAAGLNYGEPVREKDGNSAVQDLIYIMALEFASEMERSFGMQSMAEHYDSIAKAMRSTIKEKYWDSERSLFADTHDHRSFSQHANSLAILTGVVTGDEAKSIMRRLLDDKSLIQCTIYFRYYLNQALKVSGLGDLFLDNLDVWRDQMALGLTTWAEMPEPSRSDCHAWGASPNIEFYRILLGIDSGAPGFSSVRISPSLCGLKNLSGSMPHPLGLISVSYTIDDYGEGEARVILPEGLSGVFIWEGKELPLISGDQVISLSSHR